MRDDSAAPDAGRVERYARAICQAEGMDPDGCLEGSPDWMYREAEPRAAIALANAEAAERRPAEVDNDVVYAWVRGIYESTGGATPALREAYAAYQAWERGAGTAGRDMDGGENG